MSKEKSCCFFGHRNISESVKDDLRKEVRSLIENEGVRKFYVGTHGDFDKMAYRVLKEMKSEYPHIEYTVVLAYMPGKKEEYHFYSPEETLYPDGIEKVPKRYAILWRNDWMLKQCDYMICCIEHLFGGSGIMLEKAIKQKKKIFNLTDYLPG